MRVSLAIEIRMQCDVRKLFKHEGSETQLHFLTLSLYTRRTFDVCRFYGN